MIALRDAPELVVIETPYAGDRDLHDAYLKACMKDSFDRGEYPYASHAIYPGVLDDDVPEERTLGMEAGFAWGAMAQKRVFYVDLGISSGMAQALRRYDLPHEFRTLWSKDNMCSLEDIAEHVGAGWKPPEPGPEPEDRWHAYTSTCYPPGIGMYRVMLEEGREEEWGFHGKYSEGDYLQVTHWRPLTPAPTATGFECLRPGAARGE